jgi:hypothetical protein
VISQDSTWFTVQILSLFKKIMINTAEIFSSQNLKADQLNSEQQHLKGFMCKKI